MANWCMNTVEFIADEDKLKVLEQYFLALSKMEFESGFGQLPDVALEERGVMFDIELEAGVLQYNTKWSPNTMVMVAVARHFQVGFKLSFQEYGNQLFGEAFYEHHVLRIFELAQDELNLIDFDEEKETYKFEGTEYELIDEITETMIYRKKISAMNKT
ncbi:hypothetical protein [Pedobacter sp. GR22-6]|uniref:DUF1281 family ferredoxin-like fold protein n=1 Tax=Pedobacter sp. GR22-6 TaxID=3127957 RepID=UPI00307CF16D